MTYVAMSRAKNSEEVTVYFSEEVLEDRCSMDPHCEEWI